MASPHGWGMRSQVILDSQSCAALCTALSRAPQPACAAAHAAPSPCQCTLPHSVAPLRRYLPPKTSGCAGLARLARRARRSCACQPAVFSLPFLQRYTRTSANPNPPCMFHVGPTASLSAFPLPSLCILFATGRPALCFTSPRLPDLHMAAQQASGGPLDPMIDPFLSQCIEEPMHTMPSKD